MGKIVLLDELTINQIAAGEVIERPASVVKELMENSIDAGATNITVEVENGGIEKIRIIDNGTGISSDDLEFVFERHATSKIRTAKDLEEIKSMGFRGEALASIAAISHIELVSKTAEEAIGKKIVVEGGKILSQEEIGTKTGTTITISNLFFNTPVRYKFLKKDFTELGYIEDVVTRIALANPKIAIKLINKGNAIIQTPGNGDLKTVVYGIYGKDIVDGLREANYEYEGIKVTGLVGKPEIARSNRTHQIFFVNNRFVKDKTLTSAAEQAYKGLLTIGKFGFFILNIEIEPNKIDVNVHPTKLEIRFQEEQRVFKAVYYTIKEALLRDDITQNTKIVEEDTTLKDSVNDENKESTSIKEEIKKVEEEEENAIKKENTKIHNLFNAFRKKEENFIEANEDNTLKQIFEKVNNDQKEENIENNQEEKNNETSAENFEEMYKETFNKEIIKEEKKQEVENISLFEDSEEYKQIKNYKYCGTMFSTYIVIEIDNEVYIIDQHAAHERVKYEEVKRNFYNNKQSDSQLMLLPDIITLTHKEKNIIKENEELFKKAGFIYEEFGDNTIRLIGVPTMCMDLETKELFLEILDSIGTVAITDIQAKEDKFIATIACKAAVKANHELTKEEVDMLMNQLLVLPNPFTCPHGRPTAIKLTKNELEKKFSRK